MKKYILITVLLCAITITNAQKLYHVGFKISTSFSINDDYSVTGVQLTGLKCADFGVFARVGKFVYAELGLGYGFYKGTYTQETGGITLYNNEMVETRHLQIPIKAVGYVPLGKSCAFEPYAGIIYQPLLKVTQNNINFSKNNIEKNQTLLTAGFDMKLGFILLGVNYRYSFQHFFQKIDGKHPQYVNICAGFQF